MGSRQIQLQIKECSPRRDVHLHLPDGRILCGPLGTPLGEFLDRANDSELPVVAGLVENQLRELDWPVEQDCSARAVTLADEPGYRLYQASAILLLEAAIRELFPKAKLEVEHSVPFGGLFCEISGRRPFTHKELELLEQRMEELAEADEPILRETLTLEEARRLFREAGERDRLRLLQNYSAGEVRLRRLGPAVILAYGPLLPSAGKIKYFALLHHPPGFILRLPQRQRLELSPVQKYAKLARVFGEYSRWLDLLGVHDLGGLNLALAGGRGGELMLVGEALHSQRIAEIAAEICSRPEPVRVVLIAGPTSSGKTSFSRRLAVQLLANGRRPFPLSLDDYFLPRGRSPRDSQGKPDFETLEALDLELLNKQLLDLLKGRRVTLPRYNFLLGRSEAGPTVRLGRGHILLIEGLHGLNPALVPQIPQEKIFRVYVSAVAQLRLDRLTRIPTTDTRLIRRIVRDSRERGSDAQRTLEQWPSVRHGEEQYVFPYQENADAMFNSALPHELAVLKPLAEPLLRQVEPDSPQYPEARRLLLLLSWIYPCSSELVPEESILREFIGGSVVADFIPAWPA
ncbi:MAG: nucleoside kinase [Candidatus Bipolaricaulia bacterium]